jgi:DNA-binding PadR family transcriptional regulator
VPVKHVVLGLLLDRRAYGHELRGRLDERLGPGFEIPAGTFYTALGTLEREGHVREVKRAARANRERVYYEVTEAGRAEFDAWVADPFPQEALRGEAYLKVAIVDRARIPGLRAQFEALEHRILGQIAEATNAPELVDEATDPLPPEIVVRWLLDSRTLDHLNGERAFIRRTLRVLDHLEANGRVPRRKLLEAVSSSG